MIATAWSLGAKLWMVLGGLVFIAALLVAVRELPALRREAQILKM
jgi:hypothetical protein